MHFKQVVASVHSSFDFLVGEMVEVFVEIIYRVIKINHIYNESEAIG